MKTKKLYFSYAVSLMPVAFLMLLALVMHFTTPLVRADADVTPPSDIENLKAVAGDGQVNLSWNVAWDNDSVKGYKIYYGTTSVNVDNGQYNLGTIDAGNKITYAVKNLTNAKAYYFSITAYDPAGNESENYSNEVSATPLHGAADNEGPKVVKAEATDKLTVKVTFSEAVTLPMEKPEQAFTVKKDGSQTALEVKKAELDKADQTNKTVVLTTAAQQAVSYIFTAGIQVKDLSGNPIVSGTSDTAQFTGSNKEQAPSQQVTQQQTQQSQQQTQAVDKTPPELKEVKVVDFSHLNVTFSEAIVLSPNPTDNFIITEKKNTDNILNVNGVTLSLDGKVATLTTDPQKATGYNLIVVDVKDKKGNLISVDNNATVFDGLPDLSLTQTQVSTQQTQVNTQQQTQVQTPEVPAPNDTKAPEDVTKIVVKFLEGKATFSWKASSNKTKDLQNYVLYKSNDGKNYNAGIVLDPNQTAFDFTDLVPGMKYFVKLTTRDALGNESKGVVKSFSLPQTGPELLLLLGGSLALGKWLKRKKIK